MAPVASQTRCDPLPDEQVSNGLIEQLARFRSQRLSSDGLDFETCLARTVIDQEQWLARIVFPKL